jgi:hypothetical protein
MRLGCVRDIGDFKLSEGVEGEGERGDSGEG